MQRAKHPLGETIREELERQERSVSWLAHKLYCDRSTVYRMFERNSIDTEMLLRVSVILKRNFFEDFTRRYEEQDEKK